MAIHEWIQQGSISDELALRRGLVEIVRCEDCEHWLKDEMSCKQLVAENITSGFQHTPPNWFCANGERRRKA